MGDPLVLLGHAKEFGAEATLLVDPGWHCIYFDEVASIFVARGRIDPDQAFPAVDFAARHFRDRQWQAVPPRPQGIAHGRALLALATALEFRDGLSGTLPLSINLAAADRFRQAIAVDRATPEYWSLLGLSCWNMIADLNTLPARPDEPWDIARGILPAQATWCFRHALELDQTEQTALSSLVRALESRGMFAAAREVAAPRNSVNQQVTDGELIIPKNEGRDDVMVRLSELVEQGRGAAATRCFAEAENRGIVFDWAAGNRLATALLQIGYPTGARLVWERAGNPPAAALRSCRIATAALAAQEFGPARGVRSGTRARSRAGRSLVRPGTVAHAARRGGRNPGCM